MASQFPHSPRVLKGGLVAYRLPALSPTVITFQYNPDEVTRSLQSQTAGAGSGRGEANRLNGPPQETLSLSVEIDATDQLENPGDNATTVSNGLHPVIAALERLVYPSYQVVALNEALALAGTAFIANENAPLALLVWGPRRVVPVQVQSLTIKEEAFDQTLNPIRAKADLSLRVLTYRDLDVTNPGYWVYLAAFTQKEVMSALHHVNDEGALATLGRL
jgi:Contractile injection system tube protein